RGAGGGLVAPPRAALAGEAVQEIQGAVFLLARQEHGPGNHAIRYPQGKNDDDQRRSNAAVTEYVQTTPLPQGQAEDQNQQDPQKRDGQPDGPLLAVFFPQEDVVHGYFLSAAVSLFSPEPTAEGRRHGSR